MKSENLPILKKIEQLGVEGKYEEAVLYSWGFVEMIVDIAITGAFKVGHDENTQEHYDFIVANPFETKANFLRAIDFFTKDERNNIRKFQETRNAIVHRYHDTPLSSVFNFTEQKSLEEVKKQIVIQAINAAEACEAAISREVVRHFDSSLPLDNNGQRGVRRPSP